MSVRFTSDPPIVTVPLDELDCRDGRAEPLLRRVFTQPQVVEQWRDLAILEWVMDEPPHVVDIADGVRQLIYEWQTVESHRLRVTMEQHVFGHGLDPIVLRSVDMALFTRAEPFRG